MKKILEYLLKNNLAQIPRKGNKEMKSIYNYRRQEIQIE